MALGHVRLGGVTKGMVPPQTDSERTRKRYQVLCNAPTNTESVNFQSITEKMGSESSARVIGVNFIGSITLCKHQGHLGGQGGNLSPELLCAEYKSRVGAVANSSNRVCF